MGKKMNRCQNPECGKPVPEGKNYCSEECLKRHLEIKRKEKKRKKKERRDEFEERRVQEPSIWLGQERRKRAMDTIMFLLSRWQPIEYERFVAKVSYYTGLSLRKITDDYLRVLVNVGFVERNGNLLRLTDEGMKEAELKGLV